MSTIDDYLAILPPDYRAEFERIRCIVKEAVPDATEGLSYGMPAYLYKGKAFLSAIARREHLSLYPYSGKTVEELKEKLAGYELTSGSIHFNVHNPLPEALLKEIIGVRLREIDHQAQGH